MIKEQGNIIFSTRQTSSKGVRKRARERERASKRKMYVSLLVVFLRVKRHSTIRRIKNEKTRNVIVLTHCPLFFQMADDQHVEDVSSTPIFVRAECK